MQAVSVSRRRPDKPKTERAQPRIWDKSWQRARLRFGLLFASPAFIFFGIFYVYPLFRTFYVSLFSWSLLDEPRFIGVTNYANLCQRQRIHQSIWVSASTTPLAYVSPSGSSHWVSRLLFNQAFRFRQAYLTVYYLPAVISLTVWSLIWLFMYNPSFGLFSEFTRWLGFTRCAHA